MSRSKDNQTIWLVNIVSREKYFLQKLQRKWGRETSSRPVLLFKKNVLCVKSKRSVLYFHYISIALNLAYNRNELYKTLDYLSKDMLKFGFLEKDLEIVSPPHFVLTLSF